MFQLNDGSYVVDYGEYPLDKEFINFSFKKNDYKKNSPALRVYFKNDLKFNVRILKKLIQLIKSGVNFCSYVNEKPVSYIISNYNNDDVLMAFKALYIEDEREKFEFLYNTIFDELEQIWQDINPCSFCNNVCVGNKHRQSPSDIDGCCYSFEYPKHPIFSLNFIKNVKKCKYLDHNKKSCSTKNLSCKFFICPYVKRTSSFDICMTDFLLIETFFSKKQKLILRYNYFKSQEEIIDKLLQKDKTPYFVYYWRSNYRISAQN